MLGAKFAKVRNSLKRKGAEAQRAQGGMDLLPLDDAKDAAFVNFSLTTIP